MIRYTALFYSLCLLPLVPLIDAKDVKYCDKKADYDVKISGVEITPYLAARGKTANFSIAASTDKSISGGKQVIEVAYFGWYIHSESHDLCGETSCPANGDFVISHAQVLPGLTPPVQRWRWRSARTRYSTSQRCSPHQKGTSFFAAKATSDSGIDIYPMC